MTTPVKCEECDKSFANQHNLQQHKNRFHTKKELPIFEKGKIVGWMDAE
jgi:hypothetical protein